MIRCNVGGKVTAFSSVGEARELVVSLGGAVAAAFAALVESRVMLGHVLRSLRGACTEVQWDDFCRSTGLHARRISEAMRVAEQFATETGAVDWAKYREWAGEKAKPSVRAMVAAIAAREARERAAAAPAVDAEELAREMERQVEATAAESAAAARRAAEAAELAALEATMGIAAGEAEQAVERVEVAVAGVEVQAESRPARTEKGARGAQLHLGPLFEAAWAAMARLEEVCGRIGVGGLEGAFGVLRERLTAAAAAA